MTAQTYESASAKFYTIWVLTSDYDSFSKLVEKWTPEFITLDKDEALLTVERMRNDGKDCRLVYSVTSFCPPFSHWA